MGSFPETYNDPFFVLKIIAHEYKNQIDNDTLYINIGLALT